MQLPIGARVLILVEGPWLPGLGNGNRKKVEHVVEGIEVQVEMTSLNNWQKHRSICSDLTLYIGVCPICHGLFEQNWIAPPNLKRVEETTSDAFWLGERNF